jgi:hypothetical protein
VPPLYMVFDVLYARGRDLRARPLSARRAVLERLVEGSSGFSRYAGWRVTAVRVRSVANRVADCFTFHYKIGLERALEALREARRSKKVSADGRWRHLIACPVNGYRSTRRDDRDVSHPVSAEPAGE